jgi:hypothetical protein
VRGTVINAPFERVFDFVTAAEKLPELAAAFKRLGGGKALLQSPNGTVETTLSVKVSLEEGTIDWFMAFPDTNVPKAYSPQIGISGDATGTQFEDPTNNADPAANSLPVRHHFSDRDPGGFSEPGR